MAYQRKPFFKKMPVRPYEIISLTCDAIFQGDFCRLVTTKANRAFLADLTETYGVTHKGICKIIRDTYDQNAVVTEIMGATGGNERAGQGEAIVKGYSRAITALEKLLADDTLDAGFRGSRQGRPAGTVTTRDVIREDVDYLEAKRREWASLFSLNTLALTTMWRNQAAMLHGYFANRIWKAADARGQGGEYEKHDAEIFRLLSEVFRKIYKHPVYEGTRRLNPEAIRRMVGNVKKLRTRGKNNLRELTKRVFESA